MKKLGLVAAVSMAASAVVLPNAMASDDVSSIPSPSASSASEGSALRVAHSEAVILKEVAIKSFFIRLIAMSDSQSRPFAGG